MDGQNKQMVRQIPNLPKNGIVGAKARVVTEEGNLVFDIYHVKTSVKEESIDFSGKKKNIETKEELIPNPEINVDNSNLIDEQQEVENKNELSPNIQEKNESSDISDIVDEQKNEVTNKELTSDPEINIESTDLVNEQEEENKDELSSDIQENKKDTISLNGEQPKEITNETAVPDIQEKDKAASSISTEELSE
ncbi:MAG: hypothetical protein ABIK92_16070 [Pseudomonadota bacterium]